MPGVTARHLYYALCRKSGETQGTVPCAYIMYPLNYCIGFTNVNEPYTNLGHSYTLIFQWLSLKSEHNLLTMNPLGSLLTIRVQTPKTHNRYSGT